ncbi:MAG: lactoylglutathione lyase [Planctomycetota bacterium]|jgi:lactoylglutathione lyase
MKNIALTLCLVFGFNCAYAEDAGQAVPLTSGFNHLGLSVLYLDKSTQFFTETLGWKLSGEDPDYPASFLTDGEMFLTLWQVSDPASAIKFDRKNNVGLHHLAISVPGFDELDALYEKVKQVEGVVIEFAPELAYGGPTKHMMVREPSGNRLEFAHNPPKEKK